MLRSISVFLFFICQQLINQCTAQAVSGKIVLNQLGFYTHGSKVAVVTAGGAAETFYVTSTNFCDTVFTGTLSRPIISANSGTTTRLAVFSAVNKAGSYTVVIPGIGHSYFFSIADNVNKPVAVAALKGFYYQRSSQPLQTAYAGRWHRSAGHIDDSVIIHASAVSAGRPEGSIVSSPGGWYDAGDYNKYMVNAGITMGTLLSAFEDFPRYFDTLRSNIPESCDKIPDLLNEIIYNLRWMLTMQDVEDGGVYHKVTNAYFDGMVMPGVTKAPRYIVQKGTAATLNFAAVTAQAARVFGKYKKQLPGLADSCLKASEQAWQWAQKNPAAVYDQDELNKHFTPKITTGAYGDKLFSDEVVWAAAELWVTTKKRTYFDAVIRNNKNEPSLPSWANVEMLGWYTLLRFSNSLPAYSTSFVDAVKQKLLTLANSLGTNISKSAFYTVMGQSPKDFIWGSNALAANQGIALVNAWQITKDNKYIALALNNLDYILGRNATGYSFVTGMGSKTPMHPHHRPSVADGVTEPVPGLLVGGPNYNKQDGCTYLFTEPETTYVDDDCSYASNEIAINWNAPLVYLANAIEALQYRAGLSTSANH